jgi:hypothetical protein
MHLSICLNEPAYLQHHVLVPEAQAIGSIAVIRSLGRAGHFVHACATDADALGLMSKYAGASTLCPDYQSQDFLPWLREYVQKQNICTIIPSEGLLLALRSVFDEFSTRLPVPQRSDIVYAGMSKFDLFNILVNQSDPVVAEHLPPTILVTDMSRLPRLEDLAKLGTTLFIKVDGVYAIDPDSGGTVYKCTSALEALKRLKQLAGQFRKALVQGYVSGQGVGAFFLIWEGKLIAEFMHKRLHEVPYTGGVSSYRASWFHREIYDDALRKIKRLGWEGVAMMEYRWDARTKRYFLMEMNGRFWGSLHLALYAGVDFPKLLVDAFHGRTHSDGMEFTQNVYCRHTFPKELEYVWSRLKDRGLPWRLRLWPAIEFFALGVDPRIYSDLWFPGDHVLYWESIKRFFRMNLKRLSLQP